MNTCRCPDSCGFNRGLVWIMTQQDNEEAVASLQDMRKEDQREGRFGSGERRLVVFRPAFKQRDCQRGAKATLVP